MNKINQKFHDNIQAISEIKKTIISDIAPFSQKEMDD